MRAWSAGTPGSTRANRAVQTDKSPTAAEEATKGASSASAAGVPVTVSMSANHALAQTARTAGDFDAGRDQAVRAAIDQGTFTVDAGAIADKMLSNAQEILTRSRG